MATKVIVTTKTNEKGPHEKEIVQAKDASIDFPFKVKSLGALGGKDGGDPYHSEDEEFIVGEKKAKELEARGWVKIIGKVDFVQPALAPAE